MASVAATDPSRPTMLAWQPDSLALSFDELRKVTKTGRSKTYELIKSDPLFPKGTPLYDGERSPKFYLTAEAIAWVNARVANHRTREGTDYV